jgi:hypothetical protein
MSSMSSARSGRARGSSASPRRWVGSGVPPITPHDGLAIDLDLPDELLELKMEAIRAHESQIEGMISVLGAEGFRRFMRGEYFRLSAERPGPLA